MKKHLWMAVAVAMVALSVSALAEPNGRGGPDRGCGPGGPGGGRGAAIGWLIHHEDAARALGVTDDQIAQLKEVSYKARQESIKLRAELDLAQLELRRLMDAESPDEAALDKAVDQISAVEARLQKARIKEQLTARSILGEETLAKLREEMRTEMRKNKGSRARGACAAQQDGRRGRGACPMMTMPVPDAPEAAE